MYSIFVTRKIPEEGLKILRKKCSELEVYPEDKPIPKKVLIEKVRGKNGILCLLSDMIDAEVMDAAGLKAIANYAVGYDNIDVKEATKRGIIVINTPGILTEATAEMAWALLFSVCRHTVEGDRFVRAGKFKGWGPMLLLGAGLSGKTLGIIGAGRIGTAMALMSKGFNMRVLYYSRSRKEFLENELDAKKADLATLLRESDFVSIHTPLTTETRHLIGAKELSMMKPTAYLINTTRGPVVDEKALVEALRAKRIAGAGLDVYEEEPKIHPGLMELDNAVLAPHLGSATTETRSRMAVMAAEDLIAALEGRRPKNVVNAEVLKK